MDIIEILEMEFHSLFCNVKAEHHRRHPIVWGRFSGFYTIDECTGEYIVANQMLTIGVPFTCPLVFIDTAGLPGPGPIGTVASDDSAVSVGLSADGQSANVLMTATKVNPVTLTWHDPAGVVPDFTVTVTDAVAFVPATGSFGTFVEGTTA